MWGIFASSGARSIIKRTTIGICLAIVGMGIYGLIEPRFLDVKHVEATVPGLPVGWEGANVALMSDLQLGIFLDNASTSRQGVAEIVRREPELVLLAGDYVYSGDPEPSHQVSRAVELLSPLVEAGLPTYAVLGNHDIEQGAGDLLRRELGEAGIPVLTNEAVPVPAPGAEDTPLYVVGVGPHRPGMDDPAAALDDVPDSAARIVLMHNPASFPDLPAGAAPLAFGGHTHGGQIRIPFFPEWSFLALIEEQEVTVDGFIDDYGEPGNRLYVNRGIGMSVIPLRINTVPELTIVELNSGS